MSGPNRKVVVHNNSGPAVGTKEFLDERGIKAWAAVPREYILLHTSEDFELTVRFEFAAILWSWCGPHANEYVVLKDNDGYEVTDRNGNAIPAKLSDLAELLGVDKGNITRTAQALEARGSLRFDKGRGMALVFKPPPLAATEKVVVHNNWKIAGVVVHNNDLPTDPEARAQAIRFLDSCHAQWNQERNDLNARAREILRTGLLPNGIIIEKRRKSSKTSKASSSADVAVEDLTTTPVDTPFEPGTRPEPPAAPLSPSLESRITRVWIEAGKDNPSPRQLEAAVAVLPKDPDAAHQFLEYLSARVQRLEHPGAMQSVADTFRLRWANRAPPEAANGVCGKCHGIGLVQEVHRGIGVTRRCECQRKPAGSERNDDEAKERGG